MAANRITRNNARMSETYCAVRLQFIDFAQAFLGWYCKIAPQATEYGQIPGETKDSVGTRQRLEAACSPACPLRIACRKSTYRRAASDCRARARRNHSWLRW